MFNNLKRVAAALAIAAFLLVSPATADLDGCVPYPGLLCLGECNGSVCVVGEAYIFVDVPPQYDKETGDLLYDKILVAFKFVSNNGDGIADAVVIFVCHPEEYFWYFAKQITPEEGFMFLDNWCSEMGYDINDIYNHCKKKGV